MALKRMHATCLITVLAALLASGATHGQTSPKFPSLSKEALQELIRERNLLGERASQLREDGKIADAIPLVRKMVELERQISGSDHEEVAEVLAYLAALYRELDDYDQAQPCLDEIFGMMEKRHGNDHWKTVDARLAAAESLKLARLSVTDRKQFLHANSLATAASHLQDLDLWQLAHARLTEAQTIYTRLLGSDSRPAAQCLIQQAAVYQAELLPAKAEEELEQAREVYRRLVGDGHRDYAVILDKLAAQKAQLGLQSEAITMWQQALDIRLASLPSTNPILQENLVHLIELYKRRAQESAARGDWKAASRDFRKRVDLCETATGKESPLARETQSDLAHWERVRDLSAAQRQELEQTAAELAEARRWLAAGKFSTAAQLAEKSHDRREALLGVDSSLLIENLEFDLELARATGLFEDADRFAGIVVERRVRVLGERHPASLAAQQAHARLLSDWSDELVGNDDFKSALPILRRWQANLAKIYGPQDWHVKDAQLELDDTDRKLGFSPAQLAAWKEQSHWSDEAREAFRAHELLKANDLNRKVLEARRALSGPKQRLCITAMHNLGVGHSILGHYDEALSWLRQAEELRSQVHGENHPLTATTVLELAKLADAMSDYVLAESLAQRSLSILQAAGEEDGSIYGNCLEVLAHAYHFQGAMGPAEPLYRQVLQRRRAELGERHRDTANAWNNVAGFYREMGDREVASQLFERAAKIWESTEDHVLRAVALDNLSQVLLSSGDVKRADAICTRAEELLRLRGGPSHPHYIVTLSNLAKTRAATGKADEAVALADRVLTLTAVRRNHAGLALSERQQLALAAGERDQLHQYLSYFLACDDEAQTSQTARAYQHVLRWKGEVLVQQRTQRAAIADALRRKDQNAVQLVNELDRVTRQWSSLLLRPVPIEQADSWRGEIRRLSERREKLQQNLAAHMQTQMVEESAPPPARAEALKKHLLPGEVLIDYVIVDQRWWEGEPPHSRGENRLLAWIVTPTSPVKLIHLGSYSEIKELIAQWRESFGWRNGREPSAAAVKLRQRLWDSLPPEVHAAQTVLISPDGALAQLPFAALPNAEQSGFLVERHAIGMVPAALLLLAERPHPEPSADSLLVVGDVDYGQAAPGRAETWRALPGARAEIEELTRLFDHKKNVVQLTQQAANEGSLRTQFDGKQFVHIATHGFFDLPRVRASLAAAADRYSSGVGERSFAASADLMEPGLLAGIALANANRDGTASDDGLLTAVEFAGCNLAAAELITLSACESGLGVEETGEGVIGMQRSITASGARTSVTSLWKVDDAATKLLMVEFYRNLWDLKMPRAEALRQAQLKILRRGLDQPDLVRTLTDGRSRGLIAVDLPETAASILPPYYWAAFVLYGDWR